MVKYYADLIMRRNIFRQRMMRSDDQNVNFALFGLLGNGKF